MNKEIELKAHIDEPGKLKEKLTELFGEPEILEKSDIYYMYESAGDDEQGQPVRLRSENGENIVTLKRKTYTDGIEINDELEFNVDNPENFLKFLDLTGAKGWIKKSKKGWKFRVDKKDGNKDKTLAELCEVSSLGWFLEIETVIDSDDAERIRLAEKKIKMILKDSGVDSKRIEPRCYSDLLLEKL